MVLDREKFTKEWSFVRLVTRHFDEQIELPDGKKLRTLKDAIAWLAKEIPKSEHGMKQLQAAAHCIPDAAENNGPMIFARIGMMQPPVKSSQPTAGHYADDERNCQSLEWCALGPLSQAIEWRARLAARVDRVGHRLSRCLHGFSSRLDGFLRALELRCTIRILKRFAFADHLESPSQHAGYHRQRVDAGGRTSFQTHWRAAVNPYKTAPTQRAGGTGAALTEQRGSGAKRLLAAPNTMGSKKDRSAALAHYSGAMRKTDADRFPAWLRNASKRRRRRSARSIRTRGSSLRRSGFSSRGRQRNGDADPMKSGEFADVIPVADRNPTR
jgi:hypothetical protein